MSQQLQKFTTEFIPEEDRLRLSCVLEDGQQVVLWLTQRLLQRLVPHLCNWLEKQPIAVAVPASPQALVLQPLLVHQMAQQVAQVALSEQKQTPVQAPSSVWSGVVVRVQLEMHAAQSNPAGPAGPPARLQLNLQVSEQARFHIVFASHTLRQWLAIVYRHYQSAQWPLAMWPQWLPGAAGDADAIRPSTDVLH